MEKAALEESEPANSKEKSSRGCTGLEAMDWTTSEICSNFRTLGFQDFSTSGTFFLDNHPLIPINSSSE